MTCDDRKCPACGWCIDRDCTHVHNPELDADVRAEIAAEMRAEAHENERDNDALGIDDTRWAS